MSTGGQCRRGVALADTTFNQKVAGSVRVNRVSGFGGIGRGKRRERGPDDREIGQLGVAAGFEGDQRHTFPPEPGG